MNFLRDLLRLVLNVDVAAVIAGGTFNASRIPTTSLPSEELRRLVTRI